MRHLLDFQGWGRREVESLFETARLMQEVLARPVKKVPALQGFTVATVFFEPSTRTRVSFELAARRMSADVVSFSASSSSLEKGESYKDTLLTLEAMGVDAYIIRSDTAGVPHQATRWVKGKVVNAGDGRRAHPTQALLDAFTLLEALGSLEGKKIAIVGDILHSRVARSNAELLPLLGAEVWCAGPPTLRPCRASASPRGWRRPWLRRTRSWPCGSKRSGWRRGFSPPCPSTSPYTRSRRRGLKRLSPKRSSSTPGP